jgi:hypothetical protein
MMGMFKESQAAAQGIVPFNPQTNNQNEFVPFVAGTNAAFVSATDQNLPMPLIENLRALVMRELHYKPKGEDVQWYVPVLGKYWLDQLNSSDYQVSYVIDGVPTTESVFAQGALFDRIDINEKGIQVKTPQVEVPINLVDGSSGSNMVCINDTTQLKRLADYWNDWLKTSGVESYSCQTGAVSTELGINVLCSVAMTRVWLPVNIQGTMSKAPSKKKIVVHDKRLDQIRHKTLTTTPYALRQAIVDLSQGTIWDAPYSQVLQTWFLPTVEEEVFPQTTQSTDLPRYQSMFDETKSAARTTGSNGISLADLHSAYAAKMTKGKLSAPDDWSNFMVEMSKQGRGGILSGLVAGLVGAAFPGVAGIATTIANALPV